MAACVAISAHSRAPGLISARRPLTGRRRPRTTSWCCASSTPNAWCHRAARPNLFALPCVNTLRASVRQVALGHLTVKDTCSLSRSLSPSLLACCFVPAVFGHGLLFSSCTCVRRPGLCNHGAACKFAHGHADLGSHVVADDRGFGLRARPSVRANVWGFEIFRKRCWHGRRFRKISNQFTRPAGLDKSQTSGRWQVWFGV